MALTRRAIPQPDWWAGLSPTGLRADFSAGLTGAAVALPQSVAFAEIAGLPPHAGFATALVNSCVAAVAGSSWHSVSGPATAISLMVFAALSPMLAPGSAGYVAAAVSLALLVGLAQLALAVARLGVLLEFVSHSVMTGFIAAAAVLIMFSQIGAATGTALPSPSQPLAFLGALPAALSHPGWSELAVAATALISGWLVRRWRPGWPNYLIALALATGLGAVMTQFGAELHVVGAVTGLLPLPSVPSLDTATLIALAPSAGAIALVGLIEALSIARAISARSGQPINGNREILGQGLSNMAGSFFGGFASSASFTRSAVNFDAGARTPLAVLIGAVILAALILGLGRAFAHVPKAALSGIIILVSLRLIDLPEIARIFRHSWSEALIATLTFLAALFVGLEFAIYAGVVLSMLLFLRDASRSELLRGAPNPAMPQRMFQNVARHGLAECPQLVICRLDGPLFFGSVEHVRRQFRRLEAESPGQVHMLFNLRGVGKVDMAGVDLTMEEAARRQRRGGSFHLHTRSPLALSKPARQKFLRVIGRDHIHLSKGHAIAAIVPTLDPARCASCTARIFRECPPPPEPPETG